MSGLLLSILSDPILLAIGGGIIATVVAFFKGRSAGADKEREKQIARERKARTIADDVDNDVGAMPPEDVRKELGRWSRHFD